MSDEERDEWVRLMLEIASRDRETYRTLRSQAWDAVARSHKQKTAEELTVWRGAAS